ncbi:MAG TPA: FtsX-like permease family protein [Gemmatimonadaceae bacterium]|nr:FtsX-like permease family protein [Gemmatimonadaceae bacterium]
MSRRWRGLAALAWRESRTARRRLLLYMSSISLGVAALVAIDSFAGNVERSIRQQSKALLGGDVSFGARDGFTPAADSLLDSLARASGGALAHVTSFASMAYVPRSERTRLAQVRAVDPGYPFYGTVVTRPAGQWDALHRGHTAFVDPGLLLALDATVGDTLTLGRGRFRIAGVLESVPGDPGIASAIAPRVFIARRWVPETQLLVFGSRADYEAVLRLPEGTDADAFLAPLEERLDSARVRTRTVAENELDLTDAVGELGRFLSLVGLAALLLGGIGVASGVHAFVLRKIDTVAVLRCLGATSGQVMAIYSAQAALMGLAGAAAGAALGVAVQLALPGVLRDVLPVDVHVRLEPTAILTGLGTGVWVALAFALRPLAALRRVSPLQALRRTADPAALRGHWREWPRLLVDALIVATVVGVAIARAGELQDGLGMSAAVGAVLLLLWLSALLVRRVTRAVLRTRWPYLVRQGVANLARPGNQTAAVMLSLGFGVFLVGTLVLVQRNLLARFEFDMDASRGNVLFFDVQEDQIGGLDSLVRAQGARVVQRTPIVTMRIAAVNGRAVDTLLRDTTRARWALRREYRSTYRDAPVPTEQITAGRWVAATDTTTLPAVSLEQEIARDLRVGVGDTITWDVQGVRVPTRVTSLREVTWARLEPNFFAVFEPRAIAAAPQQHVLLAEAPGTALTARVQQQAVRRYPNVSSIDLSLIRRTVGQIVEKASVAVRFLALFSVAMAIPVLTSAVAATQRARVREGVLLKTLGATRRQVRRILLAEYALLGLLGSATGLLLAYGGAWAAMRWIFEAEFHPVAGPALAVAAVMTALAVLLGLAGGRDVLRATPIEALRAE